MNRLTSGKTSDSKSMLSLAPVRQLHELGSDGAKTNESDDAILRLKRFDEVFEEYLARSPLAHALFRAAEIKAVAGSVLLRPILDVGCGGGEFASTSLDGPIEVGVDVSNKQLELARATDRYERLVQANAIALPYGRGTFNTVISISVLEHVNDYKSVISEMHRVLKPGGVLLVTVVLRDLHDNLLCARILRKLGLATLRRRYLSFNDWLFRHVTLLPRQRWEEELDLAGFGEVETESVVGPTVTMWWECLLWIALPYRLSQLAGRPFMWRPRWMCRMLRRVFSNCLHASAKEGSCLLIIARKPGNSQTNKSQDHGPYDAA